MRGHAGSSGRGLRRRGIVASTAVLTAFLVAGGSAVAYGAWVASTTTTTSAAAATVGVVGSLSPGSGLGIVYDSLATTGVGSVTITNTSNRDGDYELRATATSSSASLRSDVRVEIGEVQIGGAASCTSGVALSESVTGTLSGAVVKTGPLAAGASVTLCVRTSMAPADIIVHRSESLSATLSAHILVGTWRASASPIGFEQSVVGASGFRGHDASRYRILNQNQCISAIWNSYDVLSRGAAAGGDCGNEQTSQWRIIGAADGTEYVQRAYNTSATPQTRWTAVSPTVIGNVASAGGADQRWSILQRPDGLYRFINQAHPKRCLQVDPANSGKLALVTCDDGSPLQGFSFELVADAAPPPVSLRCSGNGSNFIEYGWPVLSEYQQEVDYKAYIDGVFVTDQPDGYWPAVQFYSNQSPVVPFAKTGTGALVVEVRQSVAGSAWTTTGTGLIVISSTPGGYTLACG